MLGKKGRPCGYKLSDESKDKIRQKRIGTEHSNETKEKISRSLTLYFKKKRSIYNDMYREYKEMGVLDWLELHKDEINNMDDVLTVKRARYVNQREVSYNNSIEMFGHSVTPEFILLVKERIKLESKNYVKASGV